MSGQEHSVELVGPALVSRSGVSQLARDVKNLLPGQERSAESGGLNRPSSVITFKRATVAKMQQVDNLPTTEFTIGTATSRSQAKQATDSDSLQLPFPGTGNGAAKAGYGGGSGGLRFGRDKVDLKGTGDDLALTTKLKSPAVVYQGEARLQIEFRQTTRVGSVKEETALAGLGFRAVVDRAEAQEVAITTDPLTQERSRPPVFEVPEAPEAPMVPEVPEATQHETAPDEIELTPSTRPGPRPPPSPTPAPSPSRSPSRSPSPRPPSSTRARRTRSGARTRTPRVCPTPPPSATCATSPRCTPSWTGPGGNCSARSAGGRSAVRSCRPSRTPPSPPT